VRAASYSACGADGCSPPGNSRKSQQDYKQRFMTITSQPAIADFSLLAGAARLSPDLRLRFAQTAIPATRPLVLDTNSLNSHLKTALR
jgi:hypothetical protein